MYRAKVIRRSGFDSNLGADARSEFRRTVGGRRRRRRRNGSGTLPGSAAAGDRSTAAGDRASSLPRTSSLREQAESAVHQRVAAEKDRVVGGAAAAEEVRARSHGSAMVAGSSRSDAKRSSARTRWPARFGGAASVGHQDARVDHGGVGEAGDGGGQSVGAVAVEQLAEDRARRPGWLRRSWRRIGRRRRRRAEAALLDQGPDAARDAALQPLERGRRDAARDQQLGAAVRENVGECRKQLARRPLAKEWPRRGAHARPGPASPSTIRSSGVSMSTPSRQRDRRSVTATPARSSSQRGRALSAGSGGRPARSAAREIATTSAE
jgi:hypothetical protein